MASADTSTCCFEPRQKEFIVGEPDTIGTYTITPVEVGCHIDWYLPYGIPGLFLWEVDYDNPSSASGNIYFTPTDTGTFRDTAVFGYTFRVGPGCPPDWFFSKIAAYVHVRNDSLVRVLPHYAAVTMTADTASKKWSGTTQLSLDNNVKDITIFDQFNLKGDTSDLFYTVTYNGNPVTTYTTAAYERGAKLDIHFYSQKGPLFHDTTRRVVFYTTVHSNGKDSIYNVLLDLTYKTAPYKFYATLSRDTILFTNPVGTSELQSVVLSPDPRTTRFEFPSSSHPFVFTTSDSVGKKILSVQCKPKTGGKYFDRLVIYSFLPDFFGNERRDSLTLYLEANIGIEYDSIFWERISYPDILTKCLIAKDDSLLVSGNRVLFSSNEGISWVEYDSVGRYSDFRLTRAGFIISSPDHYSSNFGKDWEQVAAVGIPQIPLQYSETIYDLAQKSNLDLLVSCQWANIYRGVVIKSSGSGIRMKPSDSSQWTYYPGNSLIGLPTRITIDSTDKVIGYTDSLLWLESGNSAKKISLISCVAFDRANKYFIGTKKNGVLVSLDSGKTWQKTGLMIPDIENISIGGFNTLYITTKDNGIYYSPDYGKNWYGVNAGLNNSHIQSICATPGSPIYLGTDSSGIYRSKGIVSSTHSINHPNSLIEIHFTQNPCTSESTTAIFSLPLGSKYSLSIFDVLGNEITNFGKNVLSSTDNSVTISANSLQNGTYFVRVRTEDIVLSGKLLISR